MKKTRVLNCWTNGSQSLSESVFFLMSFCAIDSAISFSIVVFLLQSNGSDTVRTAPACPVKVRTPVPYFAFGEDGAPAEVDSEDSVSLNDSRPRRDSLSNEVSRSLTGFSRFSLRLGSLLG